MLSEFGVCNGSRLKADDFLQNYELVLNITHRYDIMHTSLATVVKWESMSHTIMGMIIAFVDLGTIII